MKKTMALCIVVILLFNIVGCSQERIATKNNSSSEDNKSSKSSENNKSSGNIKTSEKKSNTEASGDYETTLFGKDVLTIDIKVDESKWEDFMSNATSKPTVTADVAINGDTFKKVATKTKGNTSLQQVASLGSNRYSLKLNFGKNVEGQTCYGLDKLVLNNIYGDNTYLKEYLSYEMFKYMEVPSSLCTFAKITVNGEYIGLYLAIEDVDDSFLERNYGKNFSGEAYKPESMDMDGQQGGMGGFPGSMRGGPRNGSGYNPGNDGKMPNPFDSTTNENKDKQASKSTQGESSTDEVGKMIDNNKKIQPPDRDQIPANEERPDMGYPPQGGGGMNGGSAGVNLVYTNDDTESYSNIFDYPITNIEKEDEERLVSILKNISKGENLEASIDVDEILRYAAVNVFLVNLDSYFSNMGHNYCLVEENSKLSMVPWDYNLSFGTYQLSSVSDAVNYAIDTVFYNVDAKERPIISKLLENPKYLKQYHEYLQQLCDYVSSGEFNKKVASVVSCIDTYVKNDTTSFKGYDAFTSGVEALKTFVALRSDSVKGQLNGTIPSTDKEQEDISGLIDCSNLDLSALGGMDNKDKRK